MEAKTLIEDQVVVLDGASLVNKELRRCVLVFKGGTPPILRDSNFNGCSFRFEGPATNTADFISMIAAGGPEGMQLALGMIGIHQAIAPTQ